LHPLFLKLSVLARKQDDAAWQSESVSTQGFSKTLEREN